MGADQQSQIRRIYDQEILEKDGQKYTPSKKWGKTYLKWAKKKNTKNTTWEVNVKFQIWLKIQQYPLSK